MRRYPQSPPRVFEDECFSAIYNESDFSEISAHPITDPSIDRISAGNSHMQLEKIYPTNLVSAYSIGHEKHIPIGSDPLRSLMSVPIKNTHRVMNHRSSGN